MMTSLVDIMTPCHPSVQWLQISPKECSAANIKHSIINNLKGILCDITPPMHLYTIAILTKDI